MATREQRILTTASSRTRQRISAPQRPTAPPVPAVLLALDPGVMHLGYAVLQSDETLLVSGTWIPKSTRSVLDRHLWLLSRLQDLLTAYQPGVLTYEDFIWKLTEDGGHPLRGRSAMERLLGGIQTLALVPPYPVLMPLLPQQWGAQLVGSRSHTKADVARCVNLRLKTQYLGNMYDNHTSDAVGIALVANDLIKQQAYVRRFHVECRHGSEDL